MFLADSMRLNLKSDFVYIAKPSLEKISSAITDSWEVILNCPDKDMLLNLILLLVWLINFRFILALHSSKHIMYWLFTSFWIFILILFELITKEKKEKMRQ